jgi:hypothetical protein
MTASNQGVPWWKLKFIFSEYVALGLIAAAQDHGLFYRFFFGGCEKLPDPFEPFLVKKGTNDYKTSFSLTRQFDEAVLFMVKTRP